MRIRLLNDITTLVMGHPTTVVGSKANTEKFDMMLLLSTSVSLSIRPLMATAQHYTTIGLIPGAVLTPAYWAAGEWDIISDAQ